MKKYLLITLMGICMAGMICACGKQAEQAAEANQEPQDTIITDEQTGDTPQDIIETDVQEEPVTFNNTVSAGGITLTLSEDFYQKVIIETTDNSIIFRQKSSDEIWEGSGFIVSAEKSDHVILPYAGAEAFAYSEHHMYYAQWPTDVPFAYEDAQVAAEYGELADEAEEIIKNASITDGDDTIHFDISHHIYPMSSVWEMSYEDLYDNDVNLLNRAIDEIYARHGKRFDDDDTQLYFDSMPWYEASTDAVSFDDLSVFEQDNINVISAYLADPEWGDKDAYPIKCECFTENYAPIATTNPSSEDIRSGVYNTDDLNVSTIVYSPEEMYAEDADCVLTIDGQDFRLMDYGIAMENPVMDCFYITDIQPYFGGLEIALLEYGNDDNTGTRFIVYDGNTIHDAGRVGGFPFREYHSFYDGMAQEARVIGCERVYSLHSRNIFTDYWFDYDKMQLEKEEYDGKEYELRPSQPVELKDDIIIYSDADLSKKLQTAGEGEILFFIKTDLQKNCFIRCKSGIEGYISMKEAERISEYGY